MRFLYGMRFKCGSGFSKAFCFEKKMFPRQRFSDAGRQSISVNRAASAERRGLIENFQKFNMNFEKSIVNSRRLGYNVFIREIILGSKRFYLTGKDSQYQSNREIDIDS